jgi:hypothetical protein
MDKRLVSVASFALVCAGIGSAARATGAQEQSVHTIIGRYACVTQESNHRTWRFQSVNSAWGAWLRADTTFAPQNGEPADTAATFVAYDSAAKRWNIVSLDVSGSYYTRFSTSRAFNGSRWIDGYPADNGRAVLKIFGSKRYTFDFLAAQESRSGTRSHTICNRV